MGTATYIPDSPPTVSTPVGKTAEDVRLAGWVAQLGAPARESARSRLLARIGGLTAIAALLGYLTWRVMFTLPSGGFNLAAAWTLVSFEALPLIGLVLKLVTLWGIDGRAPGPVTEAPNGMRVAVLIPTYNEPLEVLAPTVAATCALEPAHQTWVLDDGDRPWVAEMCAGFGARYVARPNHDHAKAGNLNHALAVMDAEARAGADPIDIVAVLDCDHVPLPAFLTATLGWFADEKIALVQGPQAFYNAGAFDDDGHTGEQGLFFNVLMRARHHAGAGPFWCGSTSLLRTSALRDVGGVATETITEDMHTTLKLIRAGWQTAYHHQTLAVGLAPATAEQYLLQRRRWGLGAMQVVARERLWAGKRWLSWRNFHEYLTGTLWWLEGAATIVAFLVPAAVLLSGAATSTAPPLLFTAAFTGMFVLRLWGAKRLLRGEIHWPTAFALRILRVPVGLACLWWLVTRRSLEFQVTPKAGAQRRQRGRVPRILWIVTGLVAALLAYAAAGLAGYVPWRTSAASTAAAGVWLLLATAVLIRGTMRIRAAEYATSRRNGYRVHVPITVLVDGAPTRLLDLSIGGARVSLPSSARIPGSAVELSLPGARPITMSVVRTSREKSGECAVSLHVRDDDWAGLRTLSLWLFHTPPGGVPALPPATPAVAIIEGRSARA